MAYALPHHRRDGAPARRLRVLVADDDEINRRVLSHILFALNHEVRAVSSGLQVIKELANGSYDVLFLDLHMPDMGGLEATRFILSMWKPRERPLIVALTADDPQSGRESCLDVGMDAFLSKPVGIDCVRAILDGIVQFPRYPRGTEAETPQV